MKILIDRDLCQGHAVCVTEAPGVFELDDEGKTKVLIEDPPAELFEKIRIAAKYCPNGTITIIEDE